MSFDCVAIIRFSYYDLVASRDVYGNHINAKDAKGRQVRQVKERDGAYVTERFTALIGLYEHRSFSAPGNSELDNLTSVAYKAACILLTETRL